MTSIGVDANKPNNKQQKNPLTPGDPAQLTRKMPQKQYILLDREACKVQGMPMESHKH